MTENLFFPFPRELKFDAFGTSKLGEGKSLSKKKIAILISALGRFHRANKKNLSYTLNSSLVARNYLLKEIFTGICIPSFCGFNQQKVNPFAGFAHGGN